MHPQRRLVCVAKLNTLKLESIAGVVACMENHQRKCAVSLKLNLIQSAISLLKEETNNGRYK
ncbi:hypothetical protein J6590_084541 [Homalodisca vitripennis]|nr:hypothetical protein J6590_084541 [Homalodisca vitripennis]